MNFKINDVYKSGPCSIDRHCFEGLLIVMEIHGELWLVDTYWGVNRQDNKKWRCSEAGKVFPELKYYCNLDEIEKAPSNAGELYNPEDVFVLHDYHACSANCVYYYIRKGAQKSKEVQVRALEEKIRREKSTIQSAISDIVRYSMEIARLEAQ